MGLDMYLYTGDEQVGYWRKANQIHRWFVENVQGGQDDCGEYPVSREKVHELLDLVEAVLDDPTKGPALLPTQGGFFFGTTEYDEYYLDDLRTTQENLLRALEIPESEPLVYHSSW